ncbi:porin family protein [Synechococcus sp. Cruz-9H2]|uniref:outer membrane protein n=1 Tax=unclassified Synechococcus TaxID=2626047 RepID=UPI0020CBAAA4|nr:MULTISPECIES: opacity family porin [unclassified Synechococcus]MCP9820886.1 porin family protein [Synechococcus sp. Cruz-9H2]MCP9845121.1 porin family protein [Synechococcus sp. Edmonson 11F2]MCP9857291.1 porin family protein [Synechococcus sp. Cruz-9C9]MCP9864537.1 porin family protein [Synechococcus sp. Cruz-7E5]MCP9871806.1 porin family protein [Synechococcus sp. Cruz-7B9]
MDNKKMLAVFAGFAASAAGTLLAIPARAAEPAAAMAPGSAALLSPDGTAIALSPGAEPNAKTNASLAQSFGSNEAPIYEQATGWYIGLGLGAAWPTDTGIRTRNLDDRGFENVNGDLGFGGGFSGDLAVGYDFGAIRTELSYVYTRASVNDVSFSINGNDYDLSSSGIINKNDIFVSGYWDISTGSRWTPYIGGGVGYTNLSTPRIRVSNGDESASTGSANEGLFGWQAKLGVSYGVSNASDVYLEGTYSGASGFEGDNIRYDSYNDFGAKLGFRYRFGQPAPQPVVVTPAPSPEPAPQPAPEPFVQPIPESAPIRGLW